MARIARAVAPRIPHIVVQRGNRGQPVFFKDGDYELYLELLAERCERFRVQVLAYCLMPDHTLLVAVPGTKFGLARAVGLAHQRYTTLINERKGWIGYLWQGRFASCALDSQQLLLALRYVEQAPVRAGIVRLPWRYQWSSASAHVSGEDDRLVRGKPMLTGVRNWTELVSQRVTKADARLLEQHTRTGRPFGDRRFVAKLERILGRSLTPRRPGRPPGKKKGGRRKDRR